MRAQLFMTVDTLHRGEVSWWWTTDRLHDVDYHIKVRDTLDEKIRELTGKFDVSQDMSYRCQFEGVLLEGANREEVEKATRALASRLVRFTGVRPLYLTVDKRDQ